MRSPRSFKTEADLIRMTNERWLRWAIAKHFRERGLKVNMNPVKVGNAAVEGEVEGKNWRIALEIKSAHDDIVRGLGQVAEAKTFGYDSVALVTSMRTARRITPAIFNKLDLVLLGVDAKREVHQVCPTYAMLED